MKQKLLSVRLQEDEFDALQVLAKREVRTISSWVRAKIVGEAKKVGLLNSSQTSDSQSEK